MSIKNTSGGGKFSGGPSVRTWHFHIWGSIPGVLSPGLGTKISQAMWRGQNNNNNNNKTPQNKQT